MHQKKSEVQIGKESSGISYDFNPTPPLLFHSSIHQKHQSSHQSQQQPLSPHQQQFQCQSNQFCGQYQSVTSTQTQRINHHLCSRTKDSCSTTAPYKRPFLPQAPSSLTKSQTFYHFAATPQINSQKLPFFSIPIAAKSAAFGVLHRLRHIRSLRNHLRFVLLLSLPFFFFLISHPSNSFLLDLLCAFLFSVVLLIPLNFAIPRLPPIHLFLARSFPIKLKASSALSRTPLPVFWSIGSRAKPEKKLNSGCWVRVYSNGDVYEGEFHKGKCTGSGVYNYYMSGKYEGDWIDGKYDGYGVETWARGSRYRGQYRQGLRHGFGVYRFYTGDVYAGEWSNGQSHGCGVHTCEDGSRYVGEFKWGVKHGLGHYHFRNGDRYAGEYFADKMHGFGVYRFAHGHQYEGAWHEGRRQGLGMYTFRNGETQSGHWQNGTLDIPSTQQKSQPVSPIGVYHSKVLNVVQEARVAAEKAYDVAKVDERVNRAVGAANMAGNAARVAAVKAVQKQMHRIDNNDDIPIPIPIPIPIHIPAV